MVIRTKVNGGFDSVTLICLLALISLVTSFAIFFTSNSLWDTKQTKYNLPLDHRSNRAWSRVSKLASSALIATVSQHLASAVLWAEGLLINFPLTSPNGTVTSRQDAFIAVPGVTAPASRHENASVYTHAVSSSPPSSAGAQSGTDRSTFR